MAVLEQAAVRLIGNERAKLDEVKARYRVRERQVGQFVTAYGQSCWPVESLADLKPAPFYLLATEGRVHIDKDHRWHMETLAEVCQTDPELLRATPFRVVDVTDPASEAAGVSEWEELTGLGGEGMVVKPLSFVQKGRRGLSQPAVKCRGANTCGSSMAPSTRPRKT